MILVRQKLFEETRCSSNEDEESDGANDGWTTVEDKVGVLSGLSGDVKARQQGWEYEEEIEKRRCESDKR